MDGDVGHFFWKGSCCNKYKKAMMEKCNGFLHFNNIYARIIGPGSYSIMLADLDYTGSEEALLDCNRNTYGVLHCHIY